ncbi:mg2+ transporter zinc transport [Fusarium sporotrichioides]|uniref:Mg2+ transporter zinc transport n=1 Tax=Fusarium sporotrichioides TaxID=5514 RepID=A0A395SJB9_FUSSP|nr:mg2+ transporter zinc transport [Fusarium sporotrichioides]
METPNRTCTYAFGDNGTTATVSPSGRLLRMSRHFPGKKVGYCVDHNSIPEPYQVVDRITTFLSTADDPEHNIGFYPDLERAGDGIDSVTATFIDNRWPEFTINRGKGKIEIQYYVSNRDVYQNFRFAGDQPSMTFRTETLIRQLEFADRDNSFNKAEKDDDGYHTELSSCSVHHIKRWHDREDNSKHDVQNGSQNGSEAHCLVWPQDVETGSVEMTFVYSLELINDKSINTPSNEVHLPIPRRISEMDMSNGSAFTGKPRLDRLLRRNLEHILSVCSIPVHADPNNGCDPATALTCGDVDDHRVATAASLCAKAERCYSCSMAVRIRKVLNGHLEWIFGRECRNLAGNVKCPHTWLIKAGDFYQFHNTYPLPETAGEAVKVWIKDLDTKNKLGCYEFPRNWKAPTHQFYFTDHVLIWRAIKAAESLGLKDNLSVDRTADHGFGEVRLRGGSGKTYYWSDIIQGQILKRFTAENPFSKKRMLSVSRSPSHIRFLLRNKDASLFHAMDSGLFDKPGAYTATTEDAWCNKLDTWKNLVDFQRLHEDNDDTTWDEPLRFALSMIMGQKGKPMNSLPPNEMDKMRRDAYWGSTFEIPYIIWKHAEPPDEPRIAPLPGTPQSLSMPTFDAELWIFQRTLMENRPSQNTTIKASLGSMKLKFLGNSLVDQTNIVELSDEWLYKVPGFFNQDGNQIYVEDIKKAFDRLSGSYFADDSFDNDVRGVVINVPRSKAGNKRPPRLDDLCQFARDRSQLTTMILERRVPSTSKKRLYTSFTSNPKIQRPYPQIRAESEAMIEFFSKHISYDKYFFEDTNAEKNQWTTELHLSFYSLRKKWSKESLTDYLGKRSPGTNIGHVLLTKVAMSCRLDGDFFDRYWTVYFLESDKNIILDEPPVKSIVVNMLQNRVENGDQGFTALELDALGENKEPWRQRRILELLLAQRMIDRMRKDAVEILENAESSVWNVFDTEQRARITHASPFQKVSRRCQSYQQILQIVEEDLTENLARIELWGNRDRERQNEAPRWSFNDEIKYRTIISKLAIQNNHSIQDLRQSRVNISRFNKMLTIELERMRNEIDQRREDNIKRFTYVTVIFLPLSFGTGVFSMSNTPSSQTLEGMIKTSAVALVATAVLLVFSERLESLFTKTREISCQSFSLLWFLFRLFWWKVERFFRRIPERVFLPRERDPEAIGPQLSRNE